jgi:hypothetical protein
MQQVSYDHQINHSLALIHVRARVQLSGSSAACSAVRKR